MKFEDIEEKISFFSYNSLAFYLIRILKNCEQQPEFRPFWQLLILLKWTLEFAETRTPTQDATPEDIQELLKMVEALENSHALFNLSGHLNARKTFAVLAYQQFLYQEKATVDGLARQYVLFVQMRGEHDIAKEFEFRTRINIGNLLKFFTILLMFALNDVSGKYKYKGILDNELISIAGHLIGWEQVARIVIFLMTSRKTIKSFIEEDVRHVKKYSLQVFDVTLFTQKPFLFHWKYIFIPHRDVLNQTCNYFLYDFLKNRDPKFALDLGGRMERYIETGLRELKMTYKTENDLRKSFGKEHNVVDFLIEDCVLVEAKAIELKPYASVNPEDDVLIQELRKTIGKAYATQMLSIANKLDSTREYFGIIVTYKQLYLGDSGDMWEQFLEKETAARVNNNWELTKALPVKNLFILDLDTWDLLLQVLKDNPVKLVDILREVRNTDAQPEKKLFFFSMHLKKYGVKKFTHQYLANARKYIKPWES